MIPSGLKIYANYVTTVYLFNLSWTQWCVKLIKEPAIIIINITGIPFSIYILGATCMEMAPTGTTTDSNMPTTDGSMNQIPNTDSGTPNPDSALPMATTKGEFLYQYIIVIFEYALVFVFC